MGISIKMIRFRLAQACRKRTVIKSRDYRAWRTWHHCIVHVIEPVRVNNDRKFLCNQKTKTRADIRMYNRVNWPVRELYSMWSGSEKINNFKTYCDFWRELEERGTFSKSLHGFSSQLKPCFKHNLRAVKLFLELTRTLNGRVSMKLVLAWVT